jgi:hypothetical protein
MKKNERIFSIIVLILGILICSSIGVLAQNVKREGNKFIVQQETVDTMTNCLYVDHDGKSYPVYLSPKGKAYIWVKSKKTNKMYKRYLPKVTELLQKDIEYVRK